MSHFARFLFKHDVTAANQVKARAFKPSPTNLRHSVLCIEGILDEQEREIGECVAKLVGKVLVGDCKVFLAQIRELGLDVEQEDQGFCYPPRTHWDIVGWPDDPKARDGLSDRLAEFATEQFSRY